MPVGGDLVTIRLDPAFQRQVFSNDALPRCGPGEQATLTEFGSVADLPAPVAEVLASLGLGTSLGPDEITSIRAGSSSSDGGAGGSSAKQQGGSSTTDSGSAATAGAGAGSSVQQAASWGKSSGFQGFKGLFGGRQHAQQTARPAASSTPASAPAAAAAQAAAVVAQPPAGCGEAGAASTPNEQAQAGASSQLQQQASDEQQLVPASKEEQSSNVLQPAGRKQQVSKAHARDVGRPLPLNRWLRARVGTGETVSMRWHALGSSAALRSAAWLCIAAGRLLAGCTHACLHRRAARLNAHCTAANAPRVTGRARAAVTAGQPRVRH